MMQDCYSWQLGRVERWPYPNHPWRRQKWMFRLMEATADAILLFQEAPDRWGPEATAKFLEVKRYANSVRTWD